tara:strand:+ start:339 stop:788 length:450 start_codon:yes stop_codon:yes gene_type:complete
MLTAALLHNTIITHIPHEQVYDGVQEIVFYAEKYGNDPFEMVTLAWYESRFRKSIISSAGACGVLQVIPRWHVYSCNEMNNSYSKAAEAGNFIAARWKKRFKKRYDWICHYNAGNKCHDKSKRWARSLKRLSKRIKRTYESHMMLQCRY